MLIFYKTIDGHTVWFSGFLDGRCCVSRKLDRAFHFNVIEFNDLFLLLNDGFIPQWGVGL